MDAEEIYRIIENNKDVPFVSKIRNKTFTGTLTISPYKDKFIVHSLPLSQAIKKNDFIEFGNEEEAKFFVDNYKTYWDEKGPDSMNQKQFEDWRTTKPVKFKYSGTVERIT